MSSAFPAARKWAYRAAWIYALSKLAQATLFETHFVHGPSMAPTLSPGYHATGQRDFIVVSKGGARETLRRGDVVVFWKPHNPEQLGVKRVVALEGDTVWRDARRVGKEVVQREKGAQTEAAKMGLRDVEPVLRVPWGHVWVEGDNWRESLDSNDFGPISRNLVVGKAVAIVWPFERFGRIQAVRAGDKNYPRTRVLEGEAALPKEWHGY